MRDLRVGKAGLARDRETLPGERLREIAAGAGSGGVRTLAAAVMWLCPAEATYVTGATLPIDRGEQARDLRRP